jgi:hypothetical protein
MNTQPVSIRLSSLVVGAVVALWIVTVLTGLSDRLGLSERGAFLLLVAAGMVFCMTGMKIDRYGWMNPFNLLGSALGILILILVVAVFANLPIPGFLGDRGAFTALSILIALKVGLDLLRSLYARRKVITAE